VTISKSVTPLSDIPPTNMGGIKRNNTQSFHTTSDERQKGLWARAPPSDCAQSVKETVLTRMRGLNKRQKTKTSKKLIEAKRRHRCGRCVQVTSFS